MGALLRFSGFGEIGAGPLARLTLSRLRFVGRTVLDFALPPRCPVCFAPTDAHHAVCGICWGRMPLIAEPVCAVTGAPLPLPSPNGAISPAALAKPPRYRRARAAALYHGPARTLIQGLKYADRHDCAVPMAAWMARAGCGLLEEADLIVPVPLHWRRQLARRFNQSAVLADRLGRVAEKPVAHDVLLRKRATRQQVGLTAAQRSTNVSGAFIVKQSAKNRVDGRTVLLIDDVVTTGATIDACVKAMLRSGAAHVDVLSFARVVQGEEITI